MSRIDEALKKVAAATTAEARGGVGGVVRPARRTDETTLDSYPAERATTSGEMVQVAVTEPSRAIARVRTIDRPTPPPREELPHDLGHALEGKLMAGNAASSVSLEQYRRLAAAMHELQVERDLKTLMVTSALPREGKTLTVTNLALTLSGSYARRVLLIDADLRRPSVHEVLNLPNTAGLHEALRSERSELPIRQASPLLSVLTAGKPDSNPMALLTSVRMQRLLEEASARFDWVLLDAPPVGFMPDAGLLASMTRAVLFVIGAGTTPYQLVQRATAELGRDCIIGTVLNRIDEKNIPATGYYREYYAEDRADG
jgi:capsular exopolysaccharide synthesis family protein